MLQMILVKNKALVLISFFKVMDASNELGSSRQGDRDNHSSLGVNITRIQ